VFVGRRSVRHRLLASTITRITATGSGSSWTPPALTGGAELTSSRDEQITNYGIGLTDLVKGRAASRDDLLQSSDYDVPGRIDRIERVSPIAVAFNGGEAARRVAGYLKVPVVLAGPTEWSVGGALAYVLPSSSAMNTSITLAAKRERWRTFGDWVRTQKAL
jgi:hypothetical protein